MPPRKGLKGQKLFNYDWREDAVFSSHSPLRAQLSPHPFGAGPRFRDLSVGEALASRLQEAGRTVEGASFPRR
jgi:hypothetical protein